jgi:hypothetical protein
MGKARRAELYEFAKMFSKKPPHWQLAIEHCLLFSIETARGVDLSANRWTMINCQWPISSGGFLNFFWKPS